MHVKICGITRLEDARLAAQLGADFIGLIRAASARRVSLETARSIAGRLPPTVQPVLLFRDAPLEDVCAELETSGFRWLQLHGSESVSYVRSMAERVPEARVIRAWEVSGPDAADRLAEYLRGAAEVGVQLDVVILDVPKRQPHPGYECLGEVSRRCRDLAGEFWCAGGLTPESLPAAVQAGRYAGVDVARGVEQRPGVKDPVALRRFLSVAKAL